MIIHLILCIYPILGLHWLQLMEFCISPMMPVLNEAIAVLTDAVVAKAFWVYPVAALLVARVGVGIF